MTKDELQKVRDALARFAPIWSTDDEAKREALAILDAELAKPEPEPFVYLSRRCAESFREGSTYEEVVSRFRLGVADVPLYTAPPAAKQWVGLTDEERQECQKQALEGFRHAIKTGGVNPPTIDVIVEAALRAKNTGEQA